MKDEAGTLVDWLDVDDTASTAPAPVRIAGRYEVLGLLGTGGMGSVYRVRDLELDEVVALKTLRAELLTDGDALARFRREVKLARRVAHPNVVRTHDLGQSEDPPLLFLTMELVEGRSLADELVSGGPLPPERVIHLGRQLCAGVEAAHAAGVLHRDLKPSNVLLAEGRVVVADFGISTARSAAQTQAGAVGTPRYMAPEQVLGEAVDHRADLYALGAMLYELLTGRPAWCGDSPYQIALARVHAPPPDPASLVALPPGLADVVRRCMARHPSERFPSAAALADALAAVQDGTPTGSLGLPGTVPLASARSVAVLPFRYAGPPDRAWLADGLAEELADVLTMTEGLAVRPMGGPEAGGGDAVERGRALEVDVVVDGSVRALGETVRLGVRIVDVRQRLQLWAQRFDGTLGDALVLTDHAGKAIAEALTARLREAPEAPQDPRVVDRYLRARHLLQQNGWHPPGIEAALGLMDEALVLAPGDPRLLSVRASCLASRAFYNPRTSREDLRAAREAAERAVASAPDLGDAWQALALTCQCGMEVEGMVAAARRALVCAPGLVRPQSLLGGALAEAGDGEGALRHLRAAVALDPSSPPPQSELARVLALLGRWDEAWAALAKAPDAPLLLMMRTRLALWARDPSRVELPTAAPPTVEILSPDVARWLFARAVHGHALAQEDRDRLPDPREVVPRFRPLLWQSLAEMSAATGDLDGAVHAVQESVAAGLNDLLWLERCPLLDPIRSRPEIQDAFAPLRERSARVLRAYRA